MWLIKEETAETIRAAIAAGAKAPPEQLEKFAARHSNHDGEPRNLTIAGDVA